MAKEAAFAAKVVQKASELCLKLAAEMETAEESLGKEMSQDAVQKGISIIKEGDATPVTAADFAIQGFISKELQEAFPKDRFMGEEDATSLREDDALCVMANNLASRFAKSALSKDDFLSAVDRGLEKDRGDGERVWILDPIDGTKGFMTGKNYIIGIALVTKEGEPIVSAMGNPRLHPSPCVMVAVKGHGVRYWPAEGEGPVPFSLPAEEEAKLAWREREGKASREGEEEQMPWLASFPPWLVSRPMTTGSPMPFGPQSPPMEVCCGAMIKYWCVAQGTAAGFIQFETPLKSWDHACGVLCVTESGGTCSDASGKPVRFPDREFHVDKGIICAASGTSDATRAALLGSVAST